jgi:uncharacterized protein (DUF4213/DUF364 family)
MNPHARIYDLLQDYAASGQPVSECVIGLVWTVCKAYAKSSATGTPHLGLAMSPGMATRTLPWSGTLAGKTLGELAKWVMAWEPYQATVGMAAINCSLSQQSLPPGIRLNSGNLAVFEHFLPQLKNQKVVVVGHYPGIERYADACELSILERQPQLNDYPDPAAEFLLPDADWVFLTASSLTNKTFPRLAELAQHATTVLMGPSLPWFPQWHEFGINYLAGLAVDDPARLSQTAAEGGGVRIFENGGHYHLVELSPANSMAWLKNRIAEEYAEKQRLTLMMGQWYAQGNKARFPEFNPLQHITTRLSHMDSSYKQLWDRHNVGGQARHPE